MPKSGIPERYIKLSGVQAHRFRVAEPWRGACDLMCLENTQVLPIRPCAYCVLRVKQEKLRLLIDLEAYPCLGQAVLELGNFWFESVRLGKYLSLYRVYESLTPHPDLQFSAVRHALSHSSAVLSRPKTVAELHRLFGSTNVDLRLSSHQRVFYIQLCKMLIATDGLLADALEEVLSNLYVLKEEERPLHRSQV